MRKSLLLAAAATTMLATGCTTVDDFIEMTPQQRAETVCRNAPQIRALAQQYEAYAAQANAAQTNLTRGYLLHQACRWVTVPDGAHTDCYRDKHGNQHCDTRPRYRRVQECREIPVTIDRVAETNKLTQAQQAAAAAQQQHAALYQPCLERAITLLPQQAFYYYDNNLLPP